MKIAIVCDWLTEIGGAEQVIKSLHEIYPDAPIFTSQYRKKRVERIFEGITPFPEIRAGYLNYFPTWSRRFIAPLRQNYFSSLNLSDYDAVISVTGCDAKFIKTTGIHICYCHVPTQYYWGKYKEYIKNPGFGPLNIIVRRVFKKMSPSLRKKDYLASKKPDCFVTISNFAKDEIMKYYKRDAKIIYPPVNVELFKGVINNREILPAFAPVVENNTTKKGKCQINNTTYKNINANKNQMLSNKHNDIKYDKNQVIKNEQNIYGFSQVVDNSYLNFSRQVNWKRLDLAVKACKTSGRNLILIGDGPEHKKLKKIAGKNAVVINNLQKDICKFNNSLNDSPRIFFISPQPQSILAWFAVHAKAFIFTSEEPFGIAPVEAMAAGCPVVAYNRGGAKDFLKPNKNGLFFSRQSVPSLVQALNKFEKSKLNSRSQISRSVNKFSAANFCKNIRKFVEAKSQLSNIGTKKIVVEKKKARKGFLIEKIKEALLISMPAILYFSYQPVFKLGASDSMNYELSLPIIFLIIFSIIFIPSVIKAIEKNHKLVSLAAFPIFATISIFWSKNLLRGILTAGMIWCILITGVGIFEFIHSFKKRKKKWFLEIFMKVFFGSAIIACIVCLLQCLFNSLGASSDITFLCKNCTYSSLGFPHPNGFAIEPQFMGNLLLAPAICSLYILLHNNYGKSQKGKHRLFLQTLIIITTLFLTFSRGAIYAFLISAICLVLYEIWLSHKMKNLKIISQKEGISSSPKNPGKIIGIIVLAFSTSLALQGLFAEISPTKGGFMEGVSTVISQLSLGKIKLNIDEQKIDDDLSSDTISPKFQGYVAESTDIRIKLNQEAIDLWNDSPNNMLFGIGLGSSGTSLYEKFPDLGWKKEIVQNEYLAVLLELGIVGYILVGFTVLFLISLIDNKSPYSKCIYLVVLCYLLSINFFSGLTNALHIYLLTIMMVALFSEQSTELHLLKKYKNIL